MKIVLESELELRAWSVMMEAHRLWEKNQGTLLRDMVDWYFSDILRGDTEDMIKREVERLLREGWPEEYGVSEDEYVKNGLDGFEDLDEVKKKELENDLREEYKFAQEEIAEEREVLNEVVENELRKFYHTFFNAPEKLIVICEGEVVSKEKNVVF
ncbi:MAG: hypothetical protein K6T65_13240 [Peptococcaceae bacterium]|nr:hypothetical protein [Peptococcaceae bacterium]